MPTRVTLLFFIQKEKYMLYTHFYKNTKQLKVQRPGLSI